MEILVREIMLRHVLTVSPDTSLTDLEQKFAAESVSGFPVVDQGRLVGIVSRSDVVRSLLLEQQVAKSTPDYYFDDTGFHVAPSTSWDEVAVRVGERLEQLEVKDVMSTHLIKVSPDQPLRQVAQILTDNHVHRVLVTEQDQLVGIITAMDLVRLMANGRLRPA